MEKDYLSIKKVVKDQRLKLWARFPITVSSCPAATYMYR